MPEPNAAAAVAAYARRCLAAAHAAEVAALTGWTEDQVLACNASWLTITGEQYMRLGGSETTSPDGRQ